VSKQPRADVFTWVVIDIFKIHYNAFHIPDDHDNLTVKEMKLRKEFASSRQDVRSSLERQGSRPPCTVTERPVDIVTQKPYNLLLNQLAEDLQTATLKMWEGTVLPVQIFHPVQLLA